MRQLCHCGYVSDSIDAFRRHVHKGIKNKDERHGSVASALGHLIIRGFEEDEQERQQLRKQLAAAGCD